MSDQPLRDELARELFDRHVGDLGVCDRIADSLLPIVRKHAAQTARQTLGVGTIEALENMK